MSDYPPNMTLRPLQQWPRAETKIRRRSSFSAGLSATKKVLITELAMLSGRGGRCAPSVLQIALREHDFRNDGLPRASAMPSMPGVILNIEASIGPLSYPCDTFDRWQDNVRAIALGLEALRKVGRYGISPGNEQYTGWKQLPSAGDVRFTTDEAVRYLRAIIEDEGHGLDLGTLPQIYRRARAATHPDSGGDRKQWDLVEQCGQILKAAGALS